MNESGKREKHVIPKRNKAQSTQMRSVNLSWQWQWHFVRSVVSNLGRMLIVSFVSPMLFMALDRWLQTAVPVTVVTLSNTTFKIFLPASNF